VDVNDKIFKDHVLKDFIHGLYHCSSSIAVALFHEATLEISHVYEEGGVLFRVFFYSHIVVPICQVNLTPIFPGSD